MSRAGDFPRSVKRQALERQGGLCAFCGVSLSTPWSSGDYTGYAHHLRPLRHGGGPEVETCVDLCWGHHLLLGHGLAPFGVDKQGGRSRTWVQLSPEHLRYWEVE